MVLEIPGGLFGQEDVRETTGITGAPIIGDFTDSNHDHSNTAGGGALGTMSAAVNMGTHKITNVVDPTANQEAATKKYVDDTAGGGTSYVSIPGCMFKDTSNVGNDLTWAALKKGEARSTDSSTTAIAPVLLPHGATVTAVKGWGDAASEAETWTLQRMDVTDASSVTLATANFNTEDAAIDNEVVDNNGYVYSVVTSSIDLNDTIYGIIITYTT